MDRTQRSHARSYQAEDITVSYEAAICLHAAECVRGLSAVFDTERRPWIKPEAASAAEIERVIRRCPSGALQYHRAGGAADESPDRPTTIARQPNGALVIRGDLAVDTPDGTRHETRVVLCGCGATANAPFCDHSGPCRPSGATPE
ncbi:(4Fe-4S)-binding protein [Streptomyces sp. NPDC001982]|uniref:(4Fe-4S)-binding protein n=1 Tax=Streptomyces sp. NPDC001982 TaxID=3154405 RepID=UPI003319CB8A